MPGKVILMQALLSENDGPFGWVVEPRGDHAVERLLNPLALCSRMGVVRRLRIIEHNQVEATAGDAGLERGGIAATAGCGFEIHRACSIRRKSGMRGDPGGPTRLHKAVTFQGKISGERLIVRYHRNAH